MGSVGQCRRRFPFHQSPQAAHDSGLTSNCSRTPTSLIASPTVRHNRHALLLSSRGLAQRELYHATLASYHRREPPQRPELRPPPPRLPPITTVSTFEKGTYLSSHPDHLVPLSFPVSAAILHHFRWPTVQVHRLRLPSRLWHTSAIFPRAL